MSLFSKPKALEFPPVVGSLDDAQFLQRGFRLGALFDQWIGAGGPMQKPFAPADGTLDEYRSVVMASCARAMYVGLYPAWEYHQARTHYGFLHYRGDHNPIGNVLMRRAGAELDESIQALVAARLRENRSTNAAPQNDEAALAALNATLAFILPMGLTVRAREVALYSPPEIPDFVLGCTVRFTAAVMRMLAGVGLTRAIATECVNFADHSVRGSGRLYAELSKSDLPLPSAIRGEAERTAWEERTSSAACALLDDYSPRTIGELDKCYRDPLAL